MITAIVLAGGLGTRLKSELSNIPKPMAPVNKKPFLEYLLSYWASQGIGHFHLSTGYLHQKIESYFGKNFNGIPVSYSIEESPIGTGGGLKLCLKDLNLKEKFLLINGDTFFKISLKEIINFHNKENLTMTMALFKFYEANRYGEIILDKLGFINELKSKSTNNSGYANSGVYMFNSKDLINLLDSFLNIKISLEDDILPRLIKSNFRTKGLFFNAPFLDIGVPDDYKRAEFFFNNMNDIT